MSNDFARSMGVAAEYRHTQYAPLHWVLVATALALPLFLSWATQDPLSPSMMFLVATPLLAASFCMRTLTVVDHGDKLLIRFGPIPLFRKRIAYDQITDVAESKTTWLDGWGVHYVPGRGWTYNLWGFSCVQVTLGRRRIKIGTDDPQGLTHFLTHRIAR